MLFGVWLLLGFCISNYYTSNLKAVLTTRRPEIPFETVEDLIANTDYNIQVHVGIVLTKAMQVCEILLWLTAQLWNLCFFIS